jgi:tetraacyldisaccharide 4'-kinase
MDLPRKYLIDLVSGKTKSPLSSFLKLILLLFSFVYGLTVVILVAYYRIKRLRFGAKVISVGNITLGGTGKTTFVEYLAVKLNQQGRKIAVLSRGYKSNLKKKGVQATGDEPAMLEKKLPFARIIVDKNRVNSALRAIKSYGVDTLILDDGMQQWRIFKDLEIVTIDATVPFGNYRLLPAGFLREPIGALRRADVFVLTQCRPKQDIGDLTARLKLLNPQALIVESIHRPVGFSRLDDPHNILGLDILKGKRAIIFCGIGNPDGFENSVSVLGVNIFRSIRFQDHYDYTHNNLYNIISQARQENLEAVITTEKDAVKISGLGIRDPLILVLKIKLEIIRNETEFNRRLLKLYSF